jgi:hypothetical protein
MPNSSWPLHWHNLQTIRHNHGLLGAFDLQTIRHNLETTGSLLDHPEPRALHEPCVDAGVDERSRFGFGINPQKCAESHPRGMPEIFSRFGIGLEKYLPVPVLGLVP